MDGIVFLDLLAFEGTESQRRKVGFSKKTPIKKPKPPSSTQQSAHKTKIERQSTSYIRKDEAIF
jgi:hypothetical protein